ncbi:MAG: hypothetical protein ACRD4Y_01240, partial [Candidatus Acidiferrales bacterium]
MLRDSHLGSGTGILMPFEEHEVTDAQRSQQQRCESFAARTADRVQTANNCLFALLPLDELKRLAGGWYE